MSKKISFDELKKMMEDTNIDDSDLAPYLVIDGSSDPFAPRMIPNPETVDIEEAMAGGLVDIPLALANAWARARRHVRYDRLIASGDDKYRLKVVSEGDSWFQFPWPLTDVIDHLSNPFFYGSDDVANYAIYSLGAGGDLLSSSNGKPGIIEQNEIPTALEKTGADIVLISIGGNDLLGDMGSILKEGPFEKPEDHVDFGDKIDIFFNAYREFLTSILDKFERVKILCHGYDYVIPKVDIFGGQALLKPMEDKNITDPALQKNIMKHIIDSVTDKLVDLISSLNSDRVFYVDCRGAVGEYRWHDELHPNDEGYLSVANRFHQKIVEVTGIGGDEGEYVHPHHIDPNCYYQIIEPTKNEYVRLHDGALKRWERLDTDEQLFFFIPLGDGWYQISCKASPDQVWTLTHQSIFGFGDFHLVKMGAPTPSVYNKFRLTSDGEGPTFQIDEATKNEVIDIFKGAFGSDIGPYVGCLCRWDPVNLPRQRFKLKKAGRKE